MTREAELLARAERAEAAEAALKLRALAVHAALWCAMNDAPGKALASIMDGGYVHTAVHHLIAVDTNVSPVDEWAAHVKRQDERIDLLEAQRVAAEEDRDRWHQVSVGLADQPWKQTAEQEGRNSAYYRGLLDQIAVSLGDAAVTADDGSKSDSPLHAKLPALVQAIAEKAVSQ